MRPQDLRLMIEKQPFQPFRIYVLETIEYEIRHPELAMVGQSTLTLYFPTGDDQPLSSERYMIIALLHITMIEPLFKNT